MYFLDRFRRSLVNHLKLPASRARGLSAALHEMVDNVIDHAGLGDAPVGVVAYEVTNDRLGFAVADVGRGVLASLWENGAHGSLASDSEALLAAVNKGASRRPGPAGRGVPRLLAADQYDGACAELRAGLFLRAAGAHAEWQPPGARMGPDWLARWGSNELGVEVKRPETSARAEARSFLESQFIIELMRLEAEAPLRVSTRTRLRLEFSERAFDRFATSEQAFRSVAELRALVREDALRRFARETLDVIRAHCLNGGATGHFDAGRIGTFTLQADADARPEVQFQMLSPPRDTSHEAGRILQTLSRAGKQVSGGAPGLIVLDAGGDFALTGSWEAIQETLREPWAGNVADVAVVAHHYTGDDELGASRPSNLFYVVPGKRADALERTLLTGVRVCERNHLHFDPIIAPPEHCPIRW